MTSSRLLELDGIGNVLLGLPLLLPALLMLAMNASLCALVVM